MKYIFEIILNIFIPIAAGLMFFGLARFVNYIAPLRQFTAGRETYKKAYLGLIAFGIYLASRPIQILIGPHPMPLIVNNIREFFMIGIFGPSIFIAIHGLAYGGENIKKTMSNLVYGLCLLCAVIFAVLNVFAIGGSEEIFRIGNYVAYDGRWFSGLDIEKHRVPLMSILFACRLISPVIVLAAAATLALGRALTYPEENRKFYSNMPKKLILTSIGTYFFSFSMLAVGLVYIYGNIPNQWWGYYMGAFLAGFFEAWSISLPMRKEPL
ncbi:MAG: hypothetical protein KJ967_03115 [Elusimicrobia bacterium]|nr:hypothetical protein [Elusimicrobiota bacterium]